MAQIGSNKRLGGTQKLDGFFASFRREVGRCPFNHHWSNFAKAQQEIDFHSESKHFLNFLAFEVEKKCGNCCVIWVAQSLQILGDWSVFTQRLSVSPTGCLYEARDYRLCIFLGNMPLGKCALACKAGGDNLTVAELLCLKLTNC